MKLTSKDQQEKFVTLISDFRIRSVISDNPTHNFLETINKFDIHYGLVDDVVALYIRDEMKVLGNMKPKYILTSCEFVHDEYEKATYNPFQEAGYELYQYKNLKRILFMMSTNETLAGTFYRVTIPCFFLWKNYRDIFACGVPCWGNYSRDSDFEHADLLVYYSYHPKLIDSIRYAKELGKKIVYDTDDNAVNIEPTSQWYDHITAKTTREELKEIISSVDLVTVTTEYLRLQLLELNKNIVVLPNKLDLSMAGWNADKTKHDKVIVLWAGSPSHSDDLMEYSNAIINAIKDTNSIFLLAGWQKSHDVKFVDKNTGKIIREEKNVVNKDWERVIDTFGQLGKEKFGVIESLPIDQYPVIYSQADICIAPLKDSKINRSRSNLKALESWAYELPIAVSDLPPYDTLTDGMNCLKASSVSKFGKCIKRLIENPDLRKQLGQAGKKELLKKYQAFNQEDRYKTYKELL